MNEIELDGEMKILTDAQHKSLLKKTPIAKKVGVICDDGELYFVLYKYGKSPKPYARVLMADMAYILAAWMNEGADIMDKRMNESMEGLATAH